MHKRLDMKIYSTDTFEKLKIRPVNVNDLSHYKVVKNVLTDVEGNSYDGIVINNKMWMASNFRSTRYLNGTEIPRFKDTDGGYSAYFEYPNIAKSKLKQYGLYYNCKVIKTGNLIPEGWHVPTFDEWQDLLDYLTNSKYNLSPNKKSYVGSDIAKSLCSTEGWDDDPNETDEKLVGVNQSKNNSTGFGAYPSGFWSSFDHIKSGTCLGFSTVFWSSTPYNTKESDRMWCFEMRCRWSNVHAFDGFTRFGYSIRCIKD